MNGSRKKATMLEKHQTNTTDKTIDEAQMKSDAVKVVAIYQKKNTQTQVNDTPFFKTKTQSVYLRKNTYKHF